MVRIKTKRISPEYAAEILRKMAVSGWSVDEMARFTELWQRSDRTTTIMGWLSRPEDHLDRQLEAFLKPYLLTDE